MAKYNRQRHWAADPHAPDFSSSEHVISSVEVEVHPYTKNATLSIWIRGALGGQFIVDGCDADAVLDRLLPTRVSQEAYDVNF